MHMKIDLNGTLKIKKTQNKKGISLIVLVITIIIMIILAAAIILSLNSSNIVNKANEAKISQNLKTYQEELQTYIAKQLLKGVSKEDINISGKDNMKNVFSSMTSEDAKNFAVVNGELVYNGDNNDIITAAVKLDIHAKQAIYGIKRDLSSSSSAWTRVENSENLVANATKNGVVGENNFDSIYPWSDIKTYNYNTTTNTITAWIGDSNFKYDGTNGEVLTYIPEFYYKREQKGGYEYIYISQLQVSGYTKSEAFSVGRYKMSEESNVGHSASGKIVSVSKNITQHRNLAKALGTGFGQMDYRYCILQMLYLVEYADYNAQAKLGQGWANLSYTNTHLALTSTTNNTIVVTTAQANSYVVGQQIDIVTSQGGRQVAKDRTITSIADYSQNGVTGKVITFDGEAVNVAEGNMLYSCPQKTGSCDTLEMKSGSIGAGTSGKEGVIYRGIEDFYGNVYEWVDGINIKDNQAWVCTNPTQYIVDTFASPYTKLGYINSNSNGWVKQFGYDATNSAIFLPIAVGSSTYTCDYYYQSSGNRVACVGGNYTYGINAGPFCWYMNHSSTVNHLVLGARVLKY